MMNLLLVNSIDHAIGSSKLTRSIVPVEDHAGKIVGFGNIFKLIIYGFVVRQLIEIYWTIFFRPQIVH